MVRNRLHELEEGEQHRELVTLAEIDPLRTIIVNLLETHPTMRIPIRSLLDAARRELPGVHDDF